MFRRTGRLPRPLQEFEPLASWLRPAWEAFCGLRKLAGPEEGIRVTDIVAHLDLVGVHDRIDRQRIYRHVVALEGERASIANAKREERLRNGGAGRGRPNRQ